MSGMMAFFVGQYIEGPLFALSSHVLSKGLMGSCNLDGQATSSKPCYNKHDTIDDRY